MIRPFLLLAFSLAALAPALASGNTGLGQQNRPKER
jgi:hypothetical protein